MKACTGRGAKLNEYTNPILSEIHGRERDRHCTVKAFFEALVDKPEPYSQRLFQALTKSLGEPVQNHFRALIGLSYRGLCPLADTPEYIGGCEGRIHPSDVRLAIRISEKANAIDSDDAVVLVNEKAADQYPVPLHKLYLLRANVRQVFSNIGVREYPWPKDVGADILEQIEIIEAEIRAIRDAPPEDTKDVRWKIETNDSKKAELAVLWQQYDRLNGNDETRIDAVQITDDGSQHPQTITPKPKQELTDTDALAQIRQLPNLAPTELCLTFLPNLMVKVSAQGITKSVSCDALGLVDRRRSELNTQGTALIGIASGRILPVSHAYVISRLRTILSKHLGVKSDPFLPRSKGGWKPRFKIIDSRTTQDDRAKQKAVHVQYDQKILEHNQVVSESSFEDEDDEGGEYLRRHNEDWSG